MMTTTARRYRIRVDPNKCVGSTLCVHFAAGVFALDDSGQSVVADADGDTATNVLEAAEQCPQCAIVLEDAESGKKVFP
ncbi:MAG: ferredoxin [Planctomycetes bacterium]|nr:ferredoxin [Planctomycetota bacterium]